GAPPPPPKKSPPPPPPPPKSTPPTPPKNTPPTPPKPIVQNKHPKYPYAWPWYPSYGYAPYYPPYYPYLPVMGYPLAGLFPGTTPMPSTAPESLGNQKEYTLNVSNSATVTAWRGTNYATVTFDALKTDQTVYVLIKPSAEAAEKLPNANANWKLIGKVVLVDKDNAPRQITVLGKNNPALDKVDLDKVFVVGVTITSVATQAVPK